MQAHDLSILVTQLRTAGYEARNLGSVGITVWQDGQGHYFPAEEANRIASALARREIESLLKESAAA